MYPRSNIWILIRSTYWDVKKSYFVYLSYLFSILSCPSNFLSSYYVNIQITMTSTTSIVSVDLIDRISAFVLLVTSKIVEYQMWWDVCGIVLTADSNVSIISRRRFFTSALYFQRTSLQIQVYQSQSKSQRRASATNLITCKTFERDTYLLVFPRQLLRRTALHYTTCVLSSSLSY